MKAALQEEGDQGVGLDSTGYYDQEIYGGSDSRFAGYVTSIAANEQEEVSGAVMSSTGMLFVYFSQVITESESVFEWSKLV